MVAIIDYGAGNISSVKFALDRLGVRSVLTHDKDIIAAADKVIFPGVGQAAFAMERLRKYDLVEFIPQLKQDFLGICLGMQLMCDYSEEGRTEGLGIFPVEVKRFRTDLKVPHMGWNSVHRLQSELFEGVEEGAYVYFVHSYYVPLNDFSIARTEYGLPFSAAMRRENFYATQFHPEKSGSIGERILANFLKVTEK